MGIGSDWTHHLDELRIHSITGDQFIKMIFLFTRYFVEVGMPRKRRTTKDKFEFKGFINLAFNDEERTLVNDWLKMAEPGLEDSIAVLAEAGYKVGFAYDDHAEAYVISVTCKDMRSRYAGFCFVLKHSDIGKGAAIIRYVYDGFLAQDTFDVEADTNKYDW